MNLREVKPMSIKNKKLLLTGNEAVAYGAMSAGVGYASCFPGGPTTEVVYTLADLAKEGKPYVEWALNEKVALEATSGAAMSGVRTISVMKHFGINNAADQLFAINLMGVGGMVLVVGDDPNGHSSHSEQDTRTYPFAAKIPCIEPSTPQEGYEMIQEAYRISETYELPIYYRLVKWFCHGSNLVELKDNAEAIRAPKWDDKHFQTRPIIKKHLDLQKRLESVNEQFENWAWNSVEGPEGKAPFGIVAAGYAYVLVREAIEALGLGDSIPVFKLTTLNPLPTNSLFKFMKRIETILVVEEGDSLIEERLKVLAFNEGILPKVVGRSGQYLPKAGELKGHGVKAAIATLTETAWKLPVLPDGLLELEKTLPNRQPTPRPGNPHRPTIYAVREFIRTSSKKVVFMGDVGESATIARPLMKSHAAMGAGIGMAIGAAGLDSSSTALTIVGDGTIYGFALNGMASAVYNKNRVVTLVCDNGIMESTGWQPTPTSGENLTGAAPKLDIAATLKGIGMESVVTVDSRDTAGVLEALKSAAEIDGPTAVIAYGRYDDEEPYQEIEIDSVAGKELRTFVKEFACPALGWNGETAYIDQHLCTRCGDCADARPDAIRAIVKEV